MILKTRISNHTYEFKSLREVMAKANEEKSGDMLAGIAAGSAEERIGAKIVLSNILMKDIRNNPAVPYEDDFVTRIIQDDMDESIYFKLQNKSVSEMREWILDEKTSGEMIKQAGRGMTSEMIAAVCKIMSNLDLIYASRKIRVEATCNTTIGKENVFACRLQPNHPTDDPRGVLASTMEGLSFGCGDAVIGLNPVDDSVDSVKTLLNTLDEFIRKWEIPTQHCVLAHILTQMEAIKKGANCPLLFQSLAGSDKGNASFGISKEILDEGYSVMKESGTAKGSNYMYFETGQGAELSSYSHNGWDQVVMEARCYGLARHYHPFLVNTVVGFIGPEYLYDSRQVIRAGLEDHFMGKVSSVPMGCDVCYTNHMIVDQNDMDILLTTLAAAGVNYVMGVPHADDCMLNYQSTSFHDVQTIRETFGYHPIAEFESWLEKMGFYKNGKMTEAFGDGSVFLREKSLKMKSYTTARIGVGRSGPRYKTESMLKFRADHSAAVDAVKAYVSESFLEKTGMFRVDTLCKNKDEFLKRPDKGRIINDEGINTILAKCIHNPTVQIFIADGLSAPAIEANAYDTMQAIMQGLEEYGIDYGTPFLVRHSRVATEDQVSELLGARVVCQLVGERPGLMSAESMSAYIAYEAKTGMLETRRTVVSNIHKNGTIPVKAGARIAQIIKSMLEKKVSGTELIPYI